MYFFKIININFKKVSCFTFFIKVFYGIFIILKIFNLFKNNYCILLQHCLTIWIICVLIFKIWRFLIFIIIFVFTFSCCMFLLWYCFLQLVTYYYQLKNLILPLISSKTVCHAKAIVETKWTGSGSGSGSSSLIHQLRIMYFLEHKNYEILLNFLFQNLNKLFLYVVNLHQYYLPYLIDFKNLLFQVMAFDWFFIIIHIS